MCKISLLCMNLSDIEALKLNIATQLFHETIKTIL